MYYLFTYYLQFLQVWSSIWNNVLHFRTIYEWKLFQEKSTPFLCVCSHTVLQLYLLVIWTGFAVDDLTSMKSNLYQEGSARGGA